jgi:hypothetical protein
VDFEADDGLVFAEDIGSDACGCGHD